MRIIPWFITVFLCVTVTAALAGIKYRQIAAGMAMAESMPPNFETITQTPLQVTQWTPIRRLTGSVRAPEYVQISAEAPGRVVALPFAAGEEVPAGAIIVQLFDEDLKAQRDALKADQALVALQIKRTEALKQQSLASQDQLDTLLARAQSLSAQIAALDAQITRLTLRAPFTGRLGIYQQSVGDLMQAGDLLTDLTGVTGTFWIDFNVPQGVAKVVEGQRVRVLSIDGDLIDEARVIAVSNALSANSRAYSVRAELQSDRITHGELVQIEVPMGTARAAWSVPTKSVRWDVDGPHIYQVIAAEEGAFLPHRAKRLPVQVLDEQTERAIIAGDLEPAMPIAHEGAFKLADGVLVAVNNGATQG
jgi:membrane fusion protein (multidrug efflux system)